MEEYTDYLAHYGVKGMRWGVRRYQKPDGSLTDDGKKKVSKMYKKQADKVTAELNRRSTDMYVSAYNKAAQKMNNGGIDEFNKQQEKKYGKNFAKRAGYMDDYEDMFSKELTNNMNKSLDEFYKSNKNFKKAQALVDEFGMTKWDDLAKENSEVIKKLQKSLNN